MTASDMSRVNDSLAESMDKLSETAMSRTLVHKNKESRKKVEKLTACTVERDYPKEKQSER